jgi:hypothetical protein
VQRLGEAGRRGYEMPCPGCYNPLGPERGGERVAQSLHPVGVASRSHQRRDTGVAQRVERGAGLTG